MAASSLLLTFNMTFLPRFTGGGKLKVASTRRSRQLMSTIRCSGPGFQSRSVDKYISICACVVAIKSCFAPGEPVRVGTGIFLDHTLILTSAHLIGGVAPEKLDGCVLHRPHFAETTLAVTPGGRHLRTKPLAVSFVRDLAVLKVVRPPNMTWFPSMADFLPTKDDQFVTIAHIDGLFVSMLGGVGSNISEKSFKVKAPWPLNSDLGWMKFDKSRFTAGRFYRSNDLIEEDITKEESEEEITRTMTGTPLFNARGELVGVISWERESVVYLSNSLLDIEKDITTEEEITRTMTGSPLFNEGDELVGVVSWESESVVFAASPLSVRDVVDYAMAKKPADPIVMDSWIEDSYHN